MSAPLLTLGEPAAREAVIVLLTPPPAPPVPRCPVCAAAMGRRPGRAFAAAAAWWGCADCGTVVTSRGTVLRRLDEQLLAGEARPWWRRPAVWQLVAVVVVALASVVIGRGCVGGGL